MAENIQTDSDAESQSQPGVGKVDQVNRSLHQINPNWIEDGYGIIGPQRPIIPKVDPHPTPMEFKIDNSFPPSGRDDACTPSGPPASGTVVWGSIDGVCQWIDTTTCT